MNVSVTLALFKFLCMLVLVVLYSRHDYVCYTIDISVGIYMYVALDSGIINILMHCLHIVQF